jgi:outer membrane protein OmpA-like peptidoglycan-associated protein
LVILAVAGLAMSCGRANAQAIGIDPNSGAPMFGMPLQRDGRSDVDNFRRLPFRDLGNEIRIDIAADKLFDFDHGEVRVSARDYMQQIANLIFDHAGGTVRIECRTDRASDRGVPVASQKLAQRCASAVQDWLVTQEKLTRVRFAATGVALKPAPPANPNDPFAHAPPSRNSISIVFAKR